MSLLVEFILAVICTCSFFCGALRASAWSDSPSGNFFPSHCYLHAHGADTEKENLEGRLFEWVKMLFCIYRAR